MIIIGQYEELSPGHGYPRMKDSMQDTKYERMDDIISYLENAKDTMASFRLPKDVFTGESIKVTPLLKNDGVYVWWSTLTYYISKYNLRLPKDVENHILKRVESKKQYVNE